MQILFNKLSNCSNFFSLNREDLLPQYSSHDYNIVFKKSKKPSFEPLYNFSEKELKMLKGYIKQALNKK